MWWKHKMTLTKCILPDLFFWKMTIMKIMNTEYGFGLSFCYVLESKEIKLPAISSPYSRMIGSKMLPILKGNPDFLSRRKNNNTFLMLLADENPMHCWFSLLKTNSRFATSKPVRAIGFPWNSFWKFFSCSLTNLCQFLEYFLFQCIKYQEKTRWRNSCFSLRAIASFSGLEMLSHLLSIK